MRGGSDALGVMERVADELGEPLLDALSDIDRLPELLLE